MALAAALGGAACTPELDWREVRPADSGAVLLFPCKPASHSRRVRVADAEVRMVMYACSTAGATWALAFAELGDPGRVAAALDELGRAAASNLGAAPVPGQPFDVPGATPNPSSRRLAVEGTAPDGRKVGERVALFTKGTRVFQATVLGERIDAQAAASFFASLRVES